MKAEHVGQNELPLSLILCDRVSYIFFFYFNLIDSIDDIQCVHNHPVSVSPLSRHTVSPSPAPK